MIGPNWTEVTNFFGITNEAGPGYGFFSGVGSDLGEVTILGLAITAWHHVNCHSQGCWRIARHPVEGTTYKICGHHHRELHGLGKKQVTFEHIKAKHDEAQETR